MARDFIETYLHSWGGKGTEQPSSDPSEVVGIHSGASGRQALRRGCSSADTT